MIVNITDPMSAEFWNKLKHIQASVEAMKQTVDALSERVLTLEAAPVATEELDIDTLKPKRGPGRPKKVPE